MREVMKKYKSKSKVADVLNISRASLYRKIGKYRWIINGIYYLSMLNYV